MDNIEIQRKAYGDVVKAWHWIEEIVENDRWTDDKYIESFGRVDKIGVMPLSEGLMCLLNTTEEAYRSKNLPQPEPALIIKLTKSLLKTYNEHTYDGYPYLRCDPPLSINFTDAAFFFAGALNAVIKYAKSSKSFEATLLQECQEALIQTLFWILDAKIITDGVDGCAWSWASPKESKDLFNNKMPPQTYFTANGFITLSEMLFDNYTLLKDKSRVREAFEAMVGAKKFLLNTDMIDESGHWKDFLYVKGKTQLVPSHVTSGKSYESKKEMSLYPLEALSYVNYYLNDTAYKPVRDKLQLEHKTLFDSYAAFNSTEIQQLSRAFKDCVLDLQKTEDILLRKCEIQIPNQFNVTVGAKNSYYVDGTVAYMMLNALSFFIKYLAPLDIESEEWNIEEKKIVISILEKAFKEKAFVHNEYEDQRLSIYATRSAIASLLSWGVAVPDSPSGVDTELSDEIKALVRKLYALTGGQSSDANNLTVPSGIELSYAEVEALMMLSFVIGTGLPLLLDVEWMKGHIPEYRVLYDEDSFEPLTAKEKEISKANGANLINALKDIFCGRQQEEVNKACDRIINAEKRDYIVSIYSNALAKCKDNIEVTNRPDRVAIIKGLADTIIEQFNKLKMTQMKDFHEK